MVAFFWLPVENSQQKLELRVLHWAIMIGNWKLIGCIGHAKMTVEKCQHEKTLYFEMCISTLQHF